MFYLINHNSYLLIAALIWVSTSAFALKKMSSPGNYFLIIGLGLVLAILFNFVQPKQANVSEENPIESQIGNGQAVLLELQSPY